MRWAQHIALFALIGVVSVAVGYAPNGYAQESKDALDVDSAREETTPLVTGESGGSAPRHDIVPGTGPDAVVPPIKRTAPIVAAKTLFGAQHRPAPMAARSIGFYSKGCLAGGVQLPVNGAAWQAMRLSRNRNWGHPALVATIERFATETRAQDGWPGLLVGDMSQPRGGPMLTGHASHQIGLDADIWFTPMPNRELTQQEREDLSAVSMLAPGNLSVDPKVWTSRHVALIKRAAGYPDVERVLVHPAIKKALCEAAVPPTDRAWLYKVRPVWGHFYHFHIRLGCPKGLAGCQPQPATQADDGCGKELDEWYQRMTAPPKPPGPPRPPEPPSPPLTLEQLPSECRVVLAAEASPVPVGEPATPKPAKAAKAK